jgi:hypothetical protein
MKSAYAAILQALCALLPHDSLKGTRSLVDVGIRSTGENGL